MNYYNLLEAPFDATPDEIRKAYFEAAKQFHPDITKNSDLQEKFLKIQQAYDVLINPHSRSKYDEDQKISVSAAPPFRFSYQFSRKAIPLIEGSQAFYAIMDIAANKDVDKSLLPPVNICLVIDHSTSMKGELLSKIKYEAVNFIRLLRPEDTISIIGFSDWAELVVPPTSAKQVDYIGSKVQSLIAQGSTEIFKGLSLAVETLVSMNNKHQVNQLILLTDGHTYGDEDQCYELMRFAADQGISFYGIGIGDEWNDRFLDELAKIAGGETLFVSSAQEMYNSLNDKISSSSIVYARNLRLYFNIPQAVKLSYAFRISPELSQLDNHSPINLGSIQSGKHLQVIFEFQIDELSTNISELQLLVGKLTMDVPSEKIVKHRFNIEFHRPVRLNILRQSPPRDIIDALSKLTLYRIQEKARSEVGEGKVESAMKHYHHMATHLLARGERELARTVLKEAEHLQQNKSYSDLGEKKIKYATRALLMLPEPENKKR